MSFRNTVAAEFTKLASLPSVFVALGLVLLVTPGVAALNTSALRHALDTGNTGALVDLSTIDAGLDGIPVGAIGAIVLGVTVISSEYTATRRGAGGGRQITATLTGLPRRVPLLAAKALVLSTVTALATAVAIPVSVVVAQTVLGEHGHPLDEVFAEVGGSVFGGVCYAVLTALLASAVTVLVRNGIVPLIVLIVNASLVSFSLLLSMVTPLAKYLPDLAGGQMFAAYSPVEDPLGPLAGGLVMAAWTALFLAVAAAVFVRRDA